MYMQVTTVTLSDLKSSEGYSQKLGLTVVISIISGIDSVTFRE